MRDAAATSRISTERCARYCVRRIHSRMHTYVLKFAGHTKPVFIAEDLNGVRHSPSPRCPVSISEQPILAIDKVRYVGEIVAVCVAATRAEAEDLAAMVDIDYEELPANHDMLQAAALMPYSRGLEREFVPRKLRRCRRHRSDRHASVDQGRARIRTARQCMAPIEGAASSRMGYAA